MEHVTKTLYGYTLLKVPEGEFSEAFYEYLLKEHYELRCRVNFLIEHKKDGRVAFSSAIESTVRNMLQRFSRGQTVKCVQTLFPTARRFHNNINVWAVIEEPARNVLTLEILTLGKWFDKTAEKHKCKRLAERHVRAVPHSYHAVTRFLKDAAKIRPDLIEFINQHSGKWQVQI